MKVAIFFAALCIFALVMPQAHAEEDESAVREARGAKGVCLNHEHHSNSAVWQQVIVSTIMWGAVAGLSMERNRVRTLLLLLDTWTEVDM